MVYLVCWGQAVRGKWDACADLYIKKRYPVYVLKNCADIAYTATTICDNFGDLLQVPRSSVFKIYVVNLTFLGYHAMSNEADITTLLRSKLGDDPERSCGLIITPNTGPFKQTYNETAAEVVRRGLLDNLRDDINNMLVKDCSVFFDPKSMWSKTRRCKHEIYFCISNKRNTKNLLISQFSFSNLWVRESLSAWVTTLPRHEMVDPTARLSAERGNLDQGKEHKQWLTGDSLFGQMCSDVWSGMPVSCVDVACWMDVIGYDHYLSSTIMSRAGHQQPQVPREMCACIVWGQSNQDHKSIDDFLTKRILQGLRTRCELKSYTLVGAPDLALTVTSKKMYIKPTYNEQDFTLAKPLADETFPLLQSFVDKWLCPGVPVCIQDEFKAAMVTHNTKHNPSHKTWSSQTSKRPAVTPPEGHDAVDVQPGEGDPLTMEDLKKLHSALCEKTFEEENIKIWSAADGTSYVQAFEDTVVGTEKPLAILSGEYLVGAHYTTAINDGSELFEWNMVGDDYPACFSTEPAFAKPFPCTPKKLHEFLFYLEQEGNIGSTCECHSIKRSSTKLTPADAGRYSKYEVSPTEKCGFRIKAKSPAHVLFQGIGPQAVRDSKYLCFMMRLKFVKDQKSVQPQRPALHLSRPLRLKKGVIFKLVG